MPNVEGDEATSATRIRGALVYSAAATYFQLVVQTATTLIVARLITPAELALFAIGSAVVAMIQVLRDFGIASFVIRERELTQDALNTTFLVSAGLCWAFATILFAASGSLGEFYENPGVADVMRVLSLGIALVPFGSISQAVLQRRFDFRRVFVISAVSSAVHAVASIVLAVRGHGHMALAWASVLGVAAAAVTTRLVAGRMFRVSWPPKNVRGLFAFGSRMTQIHITRVAQSRSPQLILGKSLSLPDLGMFERANGVMEMFDRLVMQAVDPLVMPYFSEKARAGNGLAAASVAATSAVASVAIPFFAFIATSADPLVRVLFGETWVAAAQYVPFLCVAAALRVPSTFVNRLGVVTDRLDLCLKAFIASAMAQIVALLIFAHTGLIGICIGLMLAAGVHALVWGVVSRLLVGTSGTGSILRAAWLPTLIVITTTGAVNFFGARANLPELVVLSVAAMVAGVSWLVGLRFSGNPLFTEVWRTVVSVFRGLRLRKA